MRARKVTAAVVTLGIALGLLASSPAVATDISDAGSESIAEIASCAGGSDNLLASIVVDSSGSLRETDPAALRVGAVLQALTSLEQLQLSDEGINVQASLATFGTNFEPLIDWGTVEGAHAQGLKDAATTTLPKRDTDYYTDYRAALRGAQASLNSQAAALRGNSCKVLFWFTDGRLDVGAQTQSAQAELCAPQGIVDSVRADRVAIVTLALFVEGGAVSAQEREQLQAIAEGAGEGVSCGTVPIPATSAPGAYLRAADAASMRRLFAQATSMIEGATPGASFTCPSTDCQNGRLTVNLDAGISGFRVIAEHAGTSTATLIAPNGDSADVAAGTARMADSEVVVTDIDGLMTIDVRSGDLSEGAIWAIQLDQASMTLVDLYYIWGAELTVTTDGPLVIGEPGTVLFTILDASGAELKPANFASITIAATIDGKVLTPQRTDRGWEAQFEVASMDVAPALHAEASARAVTAAHGLRLGPVSSTAELATRFPPKFPTLETTRLAFPTIVGDAPSDGELRFRGSDEGATRACIDTVRSSGPELAGDFVVHPADDCIDIAAGGTASLRLSLSAAHPADGRVDGEIIVRLEGVDGGDVVTAAVPFGASMVRPVDEAKRWGLIALFFLIAIAFPWGVAELLRRFGERFTLSPFARYAAVPVRVTAHGVERDSPQTTLLDAAEDFRPTHVGGTRRVTEFAVDQVRFRRSFPGFNPLASANVWAESLGGSVVAAIGGKSVMNKLGTRAPVRLPGSVDSVLVIERPSPDSSGELRGRLVVVVDSPDGVASVLDDRLESIEMADWEQIVDKAEEAFAARDAGAEAAAAKQPKRTPSAKAGRPVASKPEQRQEAEAIPRFAWDDEEPSTALPAPDAGKTTPSSSRGSKSTPGDDSPDSPPPTINFWD